MDDKPKIKWLRVIAIVLIAYSPVLIYQYKTHKEKKRERERMEKAESNARKGNPSIKDQVRKSMNQSNDY